jgi:vancomycin resistance protein VanJ
VEGQSIVIYNVHPTHPGMTTVAFFDASLRRREFTDLLNRIQSETLPVIMMGDFNLTDLSLEYRQISSTLTDTFREVGQGLGYTFPDFREARVSDSIEIIPDNFPEHLPTPLLMRLDYVFHSEEFTGVTAYVYHTSSGSDHRPLVVTLALDQTQ